MVLSTDQNRHTHHLRVDVRRGTIHHHHTAQSSPRFPLQLFPRHHYPAQTEGDSNIVAEQRVTQTDSASCQSTP